MTVLLALLALPAVGHGQSAPESGSIKSVERITGNVPEEMDAYQGMRDRFNQRATEFRDDVKRFFDIRKKEELEKVSSGYDALIQSLEAAERNQRMATIEKLNLFLDRYPSVSDADNIRFRLAELLYEKAVEDWLEAQDNLLTEEDAYDQLVE